MKKHNLRDTIDRLRGNRKVTNYAIEIGMSPHTLLGWYESKPDDPGPDRSVMRNVGAIIKHWGKDGEFLLERMEVSLNQLQAWIDSMRSVSQPESQQFALADATARIHNQVQRMSPGNKDLFLRGVLDYCSKERESLKSTPEGEDEASDNAEIKRLRIASIDRKA